MRVIGVATGSSGRSSSVRTASGTIAIGDPLIANSDGTVSSVTGTQPGLSSITQFEPTEIAYRSSFSLIFDNYNNKFIFAYYESNPSNGNISQGGKVRTITINSDNTISVGAKQTFYSSVNAGHSVNNISITFDPTDYRCGIFFVGTQTGTGYSGRGLFRSCMINGSAITMLGSEFVWETGGQTHDVKAAYGNGKHWVSFNDGADNAYSKVGLIEITGDYSTNTFNFGGPREFPKHSSIGGTGFDARSSSCAFNSTNNKFYVAYADDSYGHRATICGFSNPSTINVTADTSSVLINSNTSTQLTSSLYDSTNDRLFVIRTREDSSYNVFGPTDINIYSTSGSNLGGAGSIENIFENEVGSKDLSGRVDCEPERTFKYNPDTDAYTMLYRGKFNEGNRELRALTFKRKGSSWSGKNNYFIDDRVIHVDDPYSNIVIDYDTNRNKFLVLFPDNDNDTVRQLYMAIYTPAFTTNLTEGNFIGFAKNGAASGQTVEINTGGSVAANQSNLTIGEKYFVLEDGTLSTTATNPSVEAGVAISSTELLVKG